MYRFLNICQVFFTIDFFMFLIYIFIILKFSFENKLQECYSYDVIYRGKKRKCIANEMG